MAVSKLMIASLIVSVFLFHFSGADQLTKPTLPPAPAFSPKKIDCKSACTARCQLSKRPNLCNRACGTCCYRCSCVPPGTSGNYGACPCYGRLTTRGGIRKCP